MYHTCANAFRKHFPHLTTEQQIDLMWCGTPFPFGEVDEKEIEELATKSGAEYSVAMDIIHDEFDKVWEETRHLRPRWDEKGQRWIEPEENAA